MDSSQSVPSVPTDAQIAARISVLMNRRAPAQPVAPAPAAPSPLLLIDDDVVDAGEIDRDPAAGPVAHYARRRRRRSPWIGLSIAFHFVVCGTLGFITLAQRVEESSLFGDSTAGPVRPIGLAPPAPAHADWPDRPSRPIDLWNTPYTGPTGEMWDGAKIGDHDESADNEDYGKAKGGEKSVDGKLGVAQGFGGKSFGPGVVPTAIGVGDGPGRPRPGTPGAGLGGGIRRGALRGGRRHLVALGGGSDATERAVGAGLRWLARHQDADGSWSGLGFAAHCRGESGCSSRSEDFGRNPHRAGLTGLAVLAFLDAGYTPQSRERYREQDRTIIPGEVVARGLKWLVDNQDADGSYRLRQDTGMQTMYDDAIAALALCEACGKTNAIAYRAPARKAIGFLEAAQNPGGGWRYGIRDGDNDVSVTGWCVLAHRAAENASVTTNLEPLGGARDFVVGATNSDGRTGYLATGDADDTLRIANTPSAILCRLFVDRGTVDRTFENSVDYLLRHRPTWEEHERGTNFYYWYYGTLAMFHLDGPSGLKWTLWNDSLKKTLVTHQVGENYGCTSGSWSPRYDTWCTHEGGRVAATALATLTLEIYYRYASLSQIEGR